ncbi:AMP-dependent synthetase/ligase [Actinobaculum massiliense]|uniref:AMP-dependent synthetase/ligase n=1 Tax=Actinobaculum massiliense TaxID=202789 RepID=UPI002889BEE8|nr:AMP-dependent synthetase/ligase [Actinobaculum massiliense]
MVEQQNQTGAAPAENRTAPAEPQCAPETLRQDQHEDKFRQGKPISFTPAVVEVAEEMSIPRVLRNNARNLPDQQIIARKSAYGTWSALSWRAFEADYRALARGFIALGVRPGERLAIMCHTRYEFTLIDAALWSIDAMAVPIYETDSAEQAAWIVEDAQCRMAIVENAQMQGMLAPLAAKINTLEQIFVIESDDLTKIAARGDLELENEIDRRIDAIHASDVATIIYTSGTTGRPKGAKITHRNLLHLAINGPLDNNLRDLFFPNKRTLLFLPMAHVFARFINVAALYHSLYIAYEPDTSQLVSSMASFQPDFFLAVPRVFEKIYNAIDAKNTGFKQKMFRYYAKVAIEYSRALETPEGPNLRLRAAHIAGDHLVYGKIREATGGKLTYAISGGAPLSARLAHFFRGAGITILEGYGTTETTAPTAVNQPNRMRVGSVGPAYPGTRVVEAPDGEILAKGDHIFAGYLNNDEATKESFTDDGWYRTGDIGKIDADGYIWITGRKKQLIVTAGGKNVSPAVLEDRLRSHPLISEVVIVGDKKPFIAALVTLDRDMLPVWLKNKGLGNMTLAQAATDPQVIAAIDRAIKRANSAVSRAESVRKFVILPTDFTPQNGYLTASLKVKRDLVLRDFNDVVERDLYGNSSK